MQLRTPPATISRSTKRARWVAASRVACAAHDRRRRCLCRFLKENPAEVRLLFKELLINVTSFFATPKPSWCCKRKILPALLKGPAGRFRFSGLGGRLRHRRRSLFNRHSVARIDGRGARGLSRFQIYSTDLADEAIARPVPDSIR
jgi:hypothetical protein